MHDLNDLYFFAKVAEHGGFMAAARQIGVPKSRLSRRVAELEAQLGVQLLQRTTRRLATSSRPTLAHLSISKTWSSREAPGWITA